MPKENIITAEVFVTEKDLFGFLLYYSYARISGIISFAFSILCLIMFVVNLATGNNSSSLILLIGGSMYTLITPITMKLKAKKQISSNPSYKKPFIFKFRNEKLSIVQGDNKVDYKWKKLYRIEETKKLLLLFVSKKIAFVVHKI